MKPDPGVWLHFLHLLRSHGQVDGEAAAQVAFEGGLEHVGLERLAEVRP